MSVSVTWLSRYAEWSVYCDPSCNSHFEFVKSKARFWDRRTLEQRIQDAACKVRRMHDDSERRMRLRVKETARLNEIAQSVRCE